MTQSRDSDTQAAETDGLAALQVLHDHWVGDAIPHPTEDGGLPFLKAYHRQWKRPAPKRAVVVLAGETPATFIARAVLAAHLVRPLSVTGALGVLACFRSDAAWKRLILETDPFIQGFLEGSPESESLFPLDWFDAGRQAPVMCDDPSWESRGWRQAPLVFLPSQLDGPPGLIDGLGENPPLFVVPSAWQTDSGARTDLPDGAYAVTSDPDLAGLVEERGYRALVVGGPPGKAAMSAIAGAAFCLSADPDLLCLTQAFGRPAGGIALTQPERVLWTRRTVAGETPQVVLDTLLDLMADDRTAPETKTGAAAEKITFPLQQRPILTTLI